MAIDVHGTCEPGFEAVRETFASHFERHPTGGPVEVGAAVSIVVDGRTAVDLWAGWADGAHTRPWAHDTIVCVASCTKGVTALGAHMLAERGLLDYDAPVATYWPEFAEHGKAAITVRQVMSHQAGLAHITAELPPGGVFDWDTVIAAIAAQVPEYEPGTKHGYHTLSFGHLVGEVIHRIDGRDVGTFVREEVTAPLGVDFVIGVGPADDARCADWQDPPDGTMLGAYARSAQGTDPLTITSYGDPRLIVPAVVNTRALRAAQFPGGNGHSNARALARIYGALACGGDLDGVHLIGPATIERTTDVQVHGKDATRGLVSEYGLGWQLTGDTHAPDRTPGSFGHGGAFGSFGWANPEARLGFGYVMNALNEPEGDPRGPALLAAALRSL